MGVMRRNLLFLALFAAFCIQANATVTVREATEPDYVINSGYSEATAEDVFVQKNRANGKPAEPLYNKKQNVVVKFIKGFYSYVDPGLDESDRIHHDIKRNPSYTDL